MNSEDFDFSVKGKGHHNKGKSPTKKIDTENSKENQVSKKSTTPVISKRNTPRASITPSERPKRELRTRLRSEPKEEPVREPEEEEEELPEDIEDKDEISNVKLKVKVGYTATGAMIRPSTNGTRKKKRRFRNMHVKKNKPGTKPVPKPSVSPSKRASPSANPSDIVKEDKKETVASRTRQTSKRKRKGNVTEPVAGPSGLQKLKRSPRRVLKRPGGVGAGGEGGDESEEDDDEDLEYVCSLYPNQLDTTPSADADPISFAVESDPLSITNEPENGELNGTEEDSPCEPSMPTNGVAEPMETCPIAEESVGSVIIVDQTVQVDDTEANDEHMQVVVIGDSVDVHNYAKPHLL